MRGLACHLDPLSKLFSDTLILSEATSSSPESKDEDAAPSRRSSVGAFQLPRAAAFASWPK